MGGLNFIVYFSRNMNYHIHRCAREEVLKLPTRT